MAHGERMEKGEDAAAAAEKVEDGDKDTTIVLSDEEVEQFVTVKKRKKQEEEKEKKVIEIKPKCDGGCCRHRDCHVRKLVDGVEYLFRYCNFLYPYQPSLCISRGCPVRRWNSELRTYEFCDNNTGQFIAQEEYYMM